jgi:hypothetical protein
VAGGHRAAVRYVSVVFSCLDLRQIILILLFEVDYLDGGVARLARDPNIREMAQ